MRHNEKAPKGAFFILNSTNSMCEVVRFTFSLDFLNHIPLDIP